MTDTSQPFEVDGASCRLYRDAPQWDGLRSAAVGQFRCSDAESGAGLLAHVEKVLRDEGAEAIIGPMDGDTWHNYRLVVESDGSAAFAMEPVSGPHDLAAFERQGFVPISSYVSARAPLEQVANSVPARIEDVQVKPWDGTNAENLLDGLFGMSLSAFAANPLYKPITCEAFLELYRPLLPAVDPRLVLFAEDAEGFAGFLFGLPDLNQGARPDTVIVKTYASRRHGVGRLLVETFHRRAFELGFANVIHALMHEGNQSLNRSGRYDAQVFRRYALMGKRLGA